MPRFYLFSVLFFILVTLGRRGEAITLPWDQADVIWTEEHSPFYGFPNAQGDFNGDGKKDMVFIVTGKASIVLGKSFGPRSSFGTVVDWTIFFPDATDAESVQAGDPDGAKALEDVEKELKRARAAAAEDAVQKARVREMEKIAQQARSAADSGECLKEVESLYRVKAREKGVRLSLKQEKEELLAMGEEGPVLQILTNLVGNALKFTPSGGTVILSAGGPVDGNADPLLRDLLRGRGPECVDQKYVRILVEDTGRGISAADLSRIFNRFEQVKDARDAVHGNKGTGLGLAIARGLAEGQGGWLLAESAPGKGSVFSLYLPEDPS